MVAKTVNPNARESPIITGHYATFERPRTFNAVSYRLDNAGERISDDGRPGRPCPSISVSSTDYHLFPNRGSTAVTRNASCSVLLSIVRRVLNRLGSNRQLETVLDHCCRPKCWIADSAITFCEGPRKRSQCKSCRGRHL